MSEYGVPTREEIKQFIAARRRTADWVHRQSNDQSMSPPVCDVRTRGIDTNSTESLPPRMVLKYPDGQRDIPISYEHHHRHSRRKTSSHRRHRSLSNAAEVHQARLIPRHPEEIRVLPSRTDQAQHAFASSQVPPMMDRYQHVPTQVPYQQPIIAPAPQYVHSHSYPAASQSHNIQRPHTSHSSRPPRHAHVPSQGYIPPTTTYPGYQPAPGMAYSHSAPVPILHANAGHTPYYPSGRRDVVTDNYDYGSTYYMPSTETYCPPEIYAFPRESSSSETSSRCSSCDRSGTHQKPFLSRVFSMFSSNEHKARSKAARLRRRHSTGASGRRRHHRR